MSHLDDGGNVETLVTGGLYDNGFDTLLFGAVVSRPLLLLKLEF